MSQSDCYCFHSVGDESSGIFKKCGSDKWQLIAIINPDDAKHWNHPYPEFVTDATIRRFKSNCTYQRVELKAAFMLGEEKACR